LGKLIAFEWMSLDGVFDADSMPTWWDPYDSSDRQRCIQDVYERTDAFLMGRVTYEMLYPFWSGLPDDAMGGVAGKLNHTPKYMVSSHGGPAPWNDSTVIAGNETLETSPQSGN
jgi:dihydrofolate reductase